MKKILLLSSVLLLGLDASAKIWRINNSGSVNADFTALYHAISSPEVISGDTLHVEPSSAFYDNVTLTKRLVILGNGYFLGQNYGQQANTASSKIENFSLAEGSEGSVVAGLEVVYLYIYAGNQIVRGNHIQYLNVSPIIAGISNILISGNYIDNSIVGGSSDPAASNLIISNNYFKYVSLPGTYTGSIQYNIIDGGEGTSGAIACKGFLVQNNIFTENSASLPSDPDNSYAYNISPFDNLPEGNGNQNLADLTSMFTSTVTSPDGKWQLSEGSAAKGAGYGGTDCGMFGGSDPYRLSGLPPVPSIFYIDAPASTTGDSLNITLGVKSNP